jgi:DnaK suppressor protein
MGMNISAYRDQLERKAAELRRPTANPEANARLLRQIHIALWRCQNGRYGICLKCEREISEPLLAEVPWAVYCGACQESVDRLHQRISTFRANAA